MACNSPYTCFLKIFLYILIVSAETVAGTSQYIDTHILDGSQESAIIPNSFPCASSGSEYTSPLLVLNKALEFIGDSPIPRKKLRSADWLEKKVDKICDNVSKKVGLCPKPLEEAGFNTIDSAECFVEVFSKLKAKIHAPGVTYEEQIQILTLAPERWSINTIVDKFGVTLYMAKCARRLAEKHGILSTREAIKSGKYTKQFCNHLVAF